MREKRRMEDKVNKEKIFSLITEGLLLCLVASSLSAAFLTSLYIEFNFPKLFLIAGLSFLVLKPVLKNKLRALILMPLLLVLALAIGYLVNPTGFFSSIKDYISWFADYLLSDLWVYPSYGQTTIVLVTIVMSLIFYLLIIKLRLFTIPFILGLALFFTLWCLDHENISKYAWYYALASILSWGASYHKSLSKKFKLPKLGLWQLSVLPIAILIVFTATVITPSKDAENLQWDYLVNVVDQVDNLIFGYKGTRKPFRLTTTGYPSSTNKLGGPVRVNQDLALLVDSPLPLLLRGSVLDEYTGSSWISSISSYRYKFKDNDYKAKRESIFDYDEPIWSKIDPKGQDNSFYLPIEVTIRNVGFETSVIFHPYSLEDLKMKKVGAIPYYNTNSEVFASRDLRDNEPYTLMATVPNLTGNQDFIDYINSSEPDYTDGYIEGIGIVGDNQDYNVKLLHILDSYTSVPDTVPQRVYELAFLIARNKKTNYEKVAAIVQYLNSDNYSYSLTPNETPNGRDFVDYFLFDLKEGYCTYYASALAIMARIVGVPTRYIEGFSMPSKKNRDGLYEVKNIHGHAWVEAYFPQVGWIPIDPTPGTGADYLDSPQGAPQYDNYWQEYYRQYYEKMKQEGQNRPQTPILTPDGTGDELALQDLLIVGLVLLALVLLVILLLLVYYLLGQRRFKKLPFSDQLCYYYNEILWLLNIYGMPIEGGETPYTYAARIDKYIVNPKGSVMDISRLLIESEFGYRDLTKEDISFTEDFYKLLRHSMKKALGYHKYVFKVLIRRLRPKKKA